jgi:type I restriction enzyme R subunit
MPSFTESSTVENLIRDTLCGAPRSRMAGESPSAYLTVGLTGSGMGWQHVPAVDLPRQTHEPFVESHLRAALARLNPEIDAEPARADEVIHRLRALQMAVRSDGLVHCNEIFTEWLRGEHTMPFGENNQHVTIRLIDFDNLENNLFVAATQFTFRAGSIEKRADVVLLVNGMPLVLIEAKTPVRPAVSWADGAVQVHDIYEKQVPELFLANVFSVATEGKELRYGSIGQPIEQWGPWRHDDAPAAGTLEEVKRTLASLLRPQTVLDILENFTLFATDKQKRRTKVVCRYQQYDAANKIVERVLAGRTRKGLIWHFQGSGKSLLMLFAAQKLRMHHALQNPTVLIVVDRVDLDTQIAATFHAADIPNLEKAESRWDLEKFLRQDTRKIIITTIHKFGEVQGELNRRSNIIVLVDEAHRTQEGDLGGRMRKALPNAFFFGLTGTPINKRDRNTFATFGAEEDEHGYMSRYGFEESIRDGATLSLHFEPRLVQLRIDKDALESAFAELTGGLEDLDRDSLVKSAARTAVLLKTPSRIDHICEDIARHFREKVEPNGFKAMVVTYDQESCLLYKSALDRFMAPEASDVVISVSPSNIGREEYARYRRDRDAEERLLDRFRDPNDPLQILIVTAKLLTGFDAPILQTMYLDKPLRDHTLLQAIARTNRTYGELKTHGLIVDYLGIFDDVAKALAFDESTIRQVISALDSLKAQLPDAVQKCLVRFPGVDRTQFGYEGLMAAQECLPSNEIRDAYAADYSVLARLWEAISPDTILNEHEADYRWLTQVYISLQPTSGMGTLIWHAYGAKTIELIHSNVHVVTVSDNLEEIVLDAGLIDAIITGANNEAKAGENAREVEFKIVARLRNHMNNPAYIALSERLESLKERHELGQITSIEYLKALLHLAGDVVAVEKVTPPLDDEERGRAALTELFEQTKTFSTPRIVESIVKDIDEIVRHVRFAGWQRTHAGEKEVKQALRKTLLKYTLHRDQDLFERAYGYIRQYY